MARPTSLTAELSRALCELIERGMPVSTSCDYEGIPYSTVCKWMKRAGEPYESFATAIKSARAKAAEPMIEAVRRGEDAWQARAWYLERSDPKNWGRKDRVVAAPKDDGKPAGLEGLSSEAIIAKLKAAIAEEEAKLKGEGNGSMH